MPLDWEHRMSLGVEQIDTRHRQILARVRHLLGAVSEGGADEIRAAMRFLYTALAEHHLLEEAWMSEAGYPAAREHERTHTALLERLADARSDVAPGAAERLVTAAGEVIRMLDEHMRRDDLKLIRFWTARENLRRLAEGGPGVGATLTPIPGTLAALTPPPGMTAARPAQPPLAVARTPVAARIPGGPSALTPVPRK